MTKFLILLCLSEAIAFSFPRPLPVAPTSSERQLSTFFNYQLNKKGIGLNRITDNVARPYSEAERAGFLLFHDSTYFGSDRIKDILAQNLPEEMKLVIFTANRSSVEKIQRHYEPLVGKERLEAIYINYNESERSVWARDYTPIPVFVNTSTARADWALVEAPYFGGDNPGSGLADWLKVQLLPQPYLLEGGNFVADPKGNCVVVNKAATAQIPDSIFLQTYACKKVIRLAFLTGIGHADERVKFLSDQIAITDQQEYVETLSALGYKVLLFPRPQNGPYRTYINSLQMNGKVFVPTYGETSDEEALTLYRSVGLNTIGISANALSDMGLGAIHCITMTYPPIPR